jgi:hypothetical protein
MNFTFYFKGGCSTTHPVRPPQYILASRCKLAMNIILLRFIKIKTWKLACHNNIVFGTKKEPLINKSLHILLRFLMTKETSRLYGDLWFSPRNLLIASLIRWRESTSINKLQRAPFSFQKARVPSDSHLWNVLPTNQQPTLSKEGMYSISMEAA